MCPTNRKMEMDFGWDIQRNHPKGFRNKNGFWVNYTKDLPKDTQCKNTFWVEYTKDLPKEFQNSMPLSKII